MANRDDSSLFHVCKDLYFYQSGFLEDYAFFIRSLISLYEVTVMPEYLNEAENQTALVLRKFFLIGRGFISMSPWTGRLSAERWM